MTIRCTAIYENGTLRPTEQLDLPDGAQVELAVEYGEPTLADQLAAIADLPLEADDQGFSGSDHDRVLYGRKAES